MNKYFKNSNQLILNRSDLKNKKINIDNKTIIIGFNEPKFKKSNKKFETGDIDSKLNARLISYFLPAVEIARMQKERPRLYIMSAINAALLYNAENEEQKKIMMANNAIKIDFIQKFFNKFFYEDFILIEYVYPQDMLKISESKILELWGMLEKEYSEKLQDIKIQFAKFLYPKKFNNIEKDENLKKDLSNIDLSIAFKYAINHLFVLGDINFKGNYVHNPNGYISIGGEYEKFFNIIRELLFNLLKKKGESFFGQKVFFFENYKIVLKNKYKVPPPYSGMHKGKNKELEVTYENERDLDFYENEEKLKDQMEYMYENLISKEEYKKFWNGYKKRYFNLKERYRKAYSITEKW